MNGQPDTSIMARFLGQNWKTTLGGSLAAAGGVLATNATGKWQVAGSVILAIGLAWMGINGRDRNVTSAQMDAVEAKKPIPFVKPPAALLLGAVLFSTISLQALADDLPAFYADADASLEAHHGALAGMSDYGYTLHTGADYGDFAVEAVMSGPLTASQAHVRRSLGTDLLLEPFSWKYIEPYLCAGAGYYWGNDGYATWALDAGAGIRIPVSENVFLHFGGRMMVPFTTGNVFQPRDHFEVLEVGLGGRI